MRLLPALAMILALLAPPGAWAQDEAAPVLDVSAPFFGEGVAIPVGPNDALWQVPWSLTYTNAVVAAQSASQTSISWSLACDEDVRLLDPVPTMVQFAAGEETYTGIAEVRVAAAPTARGDVPMRCTMTGTVTDENGITQATGSVQYSAQIAFQGSIETVVPSGMRQAAPQKQIPYPIEITNTGNSRTQVVFEMVDAPGGKWNAILPEQVVLDPGETRVAVFTVATPFANGFNNGDGSFVVRAIPTSVLNPNVQADPVEIPFQAQVKGWYVPGPSLALLALGIAGLAAVVRRR